LAVRDESQVGEVRRAAAALASGIGFGPADIGRVSIVATELATNLIKHARGGEVVISAVDDAEGTGVECLALDKGPGIADLAAARRDGFSTAGSPGSGLGAIARQSRVFDIYSQPGRGTALLSRVHKGRPAGSHLDPPTARCGVINLAMSGEEACGDAWAARLGAEGLFALVVDGLGHGPLAASAAHAALRAYGGGEPAPTAALMQRLHLALRSTRGAAASAVALADDRQDVVFIGVGNVSGVVICDEGARRMVSYNGTLGHTLKPVKPFVYPTLGETLVVLASDGLAAGWSLDAYPGLRSRHPSLIAGVLYRDFTRGRDDVTVLVARRPASRRPGRSSPWRWSARPTSSRCASARGGSPICSASRSRTRPGSPPRPRRSRAMPMSMAEAAGSNSP
jgi:anti-sigma regulatory factor (Ser/Thr protein kinase)